MTKLLNRLINLFRKDKDIVAYEIPQSWLGLWRDKTNRTILLRTTDKKEIIASIFDPNERPYEINLLNDEKTPTTDLKTRISKDQSGWDCLKIEAGVIDVGPTYNLYFLTNKDKTRLKLATPSDSLNNIIIRPTLGMGLYDDWEDDLGIPWAIPINDYYKV